MTPKSKLLIEIDDALILANEARTIAFDAIRLVLDIRPAFEDHKNYIDGMPVDEYSAPFNQGIFEKIGPILQKFIPLGDEIEASKRRLYEAFDDIPDVSQ